ncbi:ferredoxin [Acrocarpospora catenulata]|uniref:ferredoxin n=1 Tax=Acrocarpospora catenulata TaxID=2836182 RepID=UPI001BDB5452|nr:ferredoxin [Acrocarpospora catenulata]
MKITVDESRCVAAGLCVTTEETVFDQDEATGIVSLLTDTPEPQAREAVREAARICPALAIAVHEDPA